LVNVRNANADNFSGTISNVSTNTFDVTTANSGGTSGSAAAYSLGFTYGGTPSAGALTIAAPSGGDCQLLSLLYATGARTSTTLSITVPQSATNGAGADSTLQNQFFPILSVKNLGVLGTNQAATLTLNTSAPFNVFNLASMNGSISNLVRLDF
jgi:hypothetical protein